MTAKKILVVEDDKVTQKYLAGILTAAGYNVLTADDPPTTLKLIRTEQPDLITLDIDLSMASPADSWDGFAIADWLRRLNNGSQPALIVMISASSQSQVANKVKAAGIFAFLQKPVTKQALLDVVARGLAEGGPDSKPAAVPAT